MVNLKRKTLLWAKEVSLAAGDEEVEENVARLQVQERIQLYCIVVSQEINSRASVAPTEIKGGEFNSEISTSAKREQTDHMYYRLFTAIHHSSHSAASGQQSAQGKTAESKTLIVGDFTSPIDTINEPGALYLHVKYGNPSNAAHTFRVRVSVTIYYTGR